MNFKSSFRFYSIIIIAEIVTSSCIDPKDTFRSTELISSLGESVYINTLNWGMTGDNQYTVITNDRDRLKERRDTIGGIEGLSPFVYRFSGDTLYVYHSKDRDLHFTETFETVHFKLITIETGDFITVLNKALAGLDGYVQP